MARYSVLTRPRPAARLVRIFESDIFHEAAAVAIALSDPEVWVDDADSPGTAYLAAHRQLVKYCAPVLPPDARAEIEGFYLLARKGLLESGVLPREVDSMLPLDDRGNVPWIPYDAPHFALADARPREADSEGSSAPNHALDADGGGA